jgi:hypothetical protein
MMKALMSSFQDKVGERVYVSFAGRGERISTMIGEPLRSKVVLASFARTARDMMRWI